jgi:hypothetical protein
MTREAHQCAEHVIELTLDLRRDSGDVAERCADLEASQHLAQRPKGSVIARLSIAPE